MFTIGKNPYPRTDGYVKHPDTATGKNRHTAKPVVLSPDVGNILIFGKRPWFSESENTTDRLGECHAALSHRRYLFLYLSKMFPFTADLLSWQSK